MSSGGMDTATALNPTTPTATAQPPSIKPGPPQLIDNAPAGEGLGRGADAPAGAPGAVGSPSKPIPTDTSATANTANIEQLNKIIKSCRTCMLTTVGEHGLHSRPMSTAGMDFETHAGEHIYFVTKTNSTKVRELRAHPQVALVFSNDASNSWASLTATVEICEDPELVRRLWNPAYGAWFPEGPNSSNIAIIRATPSCGTFWDGSYLSRLHIMFSSLKARFTGAPLDTPPLGQDIKTVVFATPGDSEPASTAPTRTADTPAAPAAPASTRAAPTAAPIISGKEGARIGSEGGPSTTSPPDVTPADTRGGGIGGAPPSMTTAAGVGSGATAGAGSDRGTVMPGVIGTTDTVPITRGTEGDLPSGAGGAGLEGMHVPERGDPTVPPSASASSGSIKPTPGAEEMTFPITSTTNSPLM